ncbi:Inner membrane protein YbbJ [Legionella birminghamensis]|uniref:inner membrane protein YbbJ n=1 Tax=Legionella birminghamensis TaxID=28083 RepID=A0A378I7F8_9GAMM|nr:NfeD family protein [Legionella birminghamensis]KTC68143.1 Inner membrane protein YbbJ [Legionella birminghamensis]STX31147.1 Inner membrane protein ybbJ [Legionella birminghamensis]
MSGLVYWHWLALALILMIAETLGAAGLLIALGMAATLTGLITLMAFLHWQWQLIWFSILCIVFTIGWWKVLRYRTRVSPPPLMNRPLDALIGRTALLSQAIENGRGKIYLNDAYWFVTGPELPVGTRVKILGVQDNTVLLVEPLDELLIKPNPGGDLR